MTPTVGINSALAEGAKMFDAPIGSKVWKLSKNTMHFSMSNVEENVARLVFSQETVLIARKLLTDSGAYMYMTRFSAVYPNARALVSKDPEAAMYPGTTPLRKDVDPTLKHALNSV